MTNDKIDELLRKLHDATPQGIALYEPDIQPLRSIVAQWAAGQSQSDDAESFTAGARWARMAAEKAFDDEMLKTDAKYFAETGGNIRCRGDGTLKHVLKELNK